MDLPLRAFAENRADQVEDWSFRSDRGLQGMDVQASETSDLRRLSPLEKHRSPSGRRLADGELNGMFNVPV
jgi:hypothetical protein